LSSIRRSSSPKPGWAAALWDTAMRYLGPPNRRGWLSSIAASSPEEKYRSTTVAPLQRSYSSSVSW